MKKPNSSICLLLLLLAGCCNCNTNTDPEPVDPKKKITLPVDGYVVLLDDPSARNLETSIIISSEFWLREIKAHGYNQPLIHDARGSRGMELMAALRERGQFALPQILFLDSHGVVLAAASFPSDINGVKRILNGGI